jgi:hypothetical protein
MTHIDEGTIHAWLDGALSETEAKEVSDHTTTCAQCGALVAEARGFIAGASRILTSLDDAPGGVLPKRAPAVASAKPARRYWQASPWVTGIAAALILAIGVKEWRERPSAKAAFLPVPATTADSLRAGEPVRLDQRSADSAVRAVRAPALQPVAPAPRPTPPASSRPRDLAEVTTAGGAGGAGVRAADAPAPGGAKVSAEAPRVAAEMKKDAAADAIQATAKLLPPPQTAAQAFAGAAVRAERDERTLAGCYGLVTQPSREAALESVAKAAAAREPEARRRLAPAATRAPSAMAATADQPLPATVRLDTTMAAVGQRTVRSEAGASIGFWQAQGDSIRVTMLGGGVRTIPTSARIACPESPE